MARTLSKREFLKQRHFDEVIDLKRKNGARLSDIQKGFFAEAIWRGYRRGGDIPPGPMNAAQRGLKKTLVDGARTSLADLDAFLLLFGRLGPHASWFVQKDLQRAMPPDLVAAVVSGLCAAMGKRYADPILAQLKGTYATAGERIQIVREPPSG